MAERMQRRLAAILSADVVGYSRLMAEDDAATIRTLEAYREEIHLLVPQHRGRVVDFTGDNFLAEFPTALDAVEAAVEIQRVLAARNQGLPPDRRMCFRIGVHLGDVVSDGERVYGDGVNIAARLEELAEPGEICVSGSVRELVQNRTKLGFEDLGERRVKNLPSPVHAFRLELEGEPPRHRLVRASVRRVVLSTSVGLGVVVIGFFVARGLLTTTPAESPPAMPTAKHLAVIPFRVLGEDPKTQLVAAGLVEALSSKLTHLQQFQETLWVVPASEVRDVAISTPSQARKAFGVTLAITGSMQRAGSGYLVTVNLVDTRTLRQLWSQVIDESAGRVHTLQDRLVLTLAEPFGIDLPPGARDILMAGGTPLFSANDLYLEGRGYLQRYESEENVDRAASLFSQALSEDPDYALALAGLGEAYWRKYELSREPRWMEEAHDRIVRAIEIQPRLARVHVTLGELQTATGRYQDAVGAFQRALQFDSLNSGGYRGLARAYQEMGRLEEAESTYLKAIELQAGYWGTHNDLGVFYYQIGRYPEAVIQFRRVIELTPDNPRGYTNLGAAYWELGRHERAADMLERSVMIEPSLEGYANLGTLYFFYLGRYADAARLFERAIELNESDFRLWRNLGAAHHHTGPAGHERATGAYTRCVELASEELRVNPRDPEVLVSLADCKAMLGQAEDAHRLLERALAYSTDDLDIMVRAGDTYEQLGDRERALEWIGEAICRGKSPDEIERAPGLAALRTDPRFRPLAAEDREGCQRRSAPEPKVLPEGANLDEEV